MFDDDDHRWTDNDEEPKDADEGTDVNPIGSLLFSDDEEETKESKKQF